MRSLPRERSYALLRFSAMLIDYCCHRRSYGSARLLGALLGARHDAVADTALPAINAK